MSKSKTLAESTEKQPTAPVIQKQTGPLEKNGEPLQLWSMAKEQPTIARMNDLASPSDNGLSAVNRARLMRTAQNSLGNSRISRKEKDTEDQSNAGLLSSIAEKSTSVTISQPQLRITPPDHPSEKQAEAVAQHVVAGKPSPVRTPAPGEQPEIALRTDDENRVQTNPQDAAETDTSQAERNLARKGEGRSISPTTRNTIESSMGTDLSTARIHDDRVANEAARSLNARAFTKGKDVFLARGESDSDLNLMAHEATHVVQQGAAPPRPVSRKPEDKIQKADQKDGVVQRNASDTPRTEETAPGMLDMKGMSKFALTENMDKYLDEHNGHGKVNARFGDMAQGPITVKKRRGSYTVENQLLQINKHPFLSQAGLNLFISVKKDGQLTGFVGIGRHKVSTETIEQALGQIGLPELTLKKLTEAKFTNKIEEGSLYLSLNDIPIRLGGAFVGSISLVTKDDAISSFKGSAKVNIPGLKETDINLERGETGLITGKAKVAVDLPKRNMSGGIDVAWDGTAVTGSGTVGYLGEKLSGDVTLNLMEAEKAKQLEQQKKAPPGEETKPSSKKEINKKKKSGDKVQYALFGEGDLTFAFTDWLNGTAHVIVDSKGFVTIIGKITPQKEFELFPQKDYSKDLFKLEARAAYGIPVVGNIFIFANIGMDAFAKIGPGKFYNIVVEGTYSTDPDKNKDFSIRGSLNISAAAGLRLRGEAGAGLEILSHDIKAGAGINAIAAIRGYAEATPIIGYREKGNPGEDKKGEFFIRGEMEIAAQPFLGLSGDLFVELDSPWWSPAPDKKWTWPLGGKEWPVGGEFGFGASVDYVFGSGEFPTVEFGKVDFSADKFLTDLYNDKAQASGQGGAEKAAKWKEKNIIEAASPAGAKKGEGKEGGKAKKPQVQPSNKATSQTTKKKANPNDKTAEGKSVKQLQDEAAKKGKKPATKEPQKGSAKESPTTKSKKKGAVADKDHAKKWERGVTVVKQALAYAEREGIDLDELNSILKSIKKRKEFGFSKLYAKDEGDYWQIYGSMSNGKKVTNVKKKAKSKLLLGEGQAGTYGDLTRGRVSGSGLSAHHMPQDSFMILYGVARNDGIAMNMEHPLKRGKKKGRHQRTRTYGRSPNNSAKPRDELNADISDVRAIYRDDGLYDTKIERALQKVRNLNLRRFAQKFKS